MSLIRPLILASASPRRAELLTQIGVPFRVLASHVDEPPPMPGQDIFAWAADAAYRKAMATAITLSAAPALVLGADTIVLLPLDESATSPLLHGCPVDVLGKPADADDAVRMLTKLSGRTHEVISAIALVSWPEGTVVTDVVATRVVFRALTPDDIAAYVATGEPLDKAGAYGIQGHGAVLIERIEGDYYTVVGLPLARLWERLRRFTTP